MKGGGRGEANAGGGAATRVIEVTKADGSDVVIINIRCSNGMKFSVHVNLESSVDSFKSLLAEPFHVFAQRLRLVYKGRILKDDLTLKCYGLKAGDTVHLIGAFPPFPPVAANNRTTMRRSGVSYSYPIDVSGLPVYEEDRQRRIHFPNMRPQAMYCLTKDSEIMRNRIRNNPILTDLVNRVPYLSRIVNDPVIYRQIAENQVYGVIIIEMMRYAYRHVRGGGGGATPDLISQLMLNPATSQLIHRIFSNPLDINWLLNPQFMRKMTQQQKPNLVFKLQLTSPNTVQWQFRCPLRAPVRTGFCEEQDRKLGTKKRSQPSLVEDDDQQQSSSSSSSSDSSQSGGETETVGPEEVYARQLEELEAMGFHDTRRNLEALIATKGNVRAAIHRLLGL